MKKISAFFLSVLTIITLFLGFTSAVFAGNTAVGLTTTPSGCGGSGKVNVAFNWTPADNPAVSGSTSIPVVAQYLDFSLDPGFNTTVTQGFDVGVGTSSRSFTDTFLANTTYYWRINTSYYPGGAGSWSPSSTANFSYSCTSTGGGGGSGGGNASLGKINPIQGVPSITGNPSSFVASAIRSSISLLIIVAFIVDLLWTIFAGIRFITASGDPKTTGAAWSQIYWGMIGMLVVLGSFAIIRVVEIFFNVPIISGGLQLPTI